MQHRPAPHQWLVAGIEEANRHQPHAEVLKRLDAVARGAGLSLRAHHQWNVGAIDVGVEQPHFAPEIGERNRQVHGDSGLADPAFAGADGHQIADAGYRELRCFLVRLLGTHVFRW